MKQNIIQSIIRRGLSFVFLSLLMPLGVGAQTNYDLWIGDKQVTSENAGDVLGDGKVSFTVIGGQAAAPTYTLTLNGVTLTQPIKVGLANLTIDIQGTNSITTEERCIQKMDNTTPAVTFTSTSAEVSNLTLKGTEGVNSVGEYKVGSFTITDKLALVLKKDGYTYSNQYWFTDGSTKEAILSTSYGVTIGSMQICADNAADVIGEGIGDGNESGSGMVSFNKETNTLKLSGANLTGPIQTSLANLIVEIEGSCTFDLSEAAAPYAFITEEASGTLTFTTKEPSSSLSVSEVQSAPFSGYADGNIIFANDLEGKIVSDQSSQSSEYQIAVPNASYGFSVDDVEVTKQNRLTIGDGIQFDGKNTLILNNANISGIYISNNHTLTNGLNIYLIGENTIRNSSNAVYGTAIPLSIATSSENPGSLAYICQACSLATANQAFNGYTVEYKNDLIATLDYTDTQIAKNNEGKAYDDPTYIKQQTVTIAATLVPVVDHTGDEAELDGDGSGLGTVLEGHTTDAQVITADKKMLMTLGENDGFFSWTPSTPGDDAKLWDGEESAKLVVLSTEQNEIPANVEPGTLAFQTACKAVTMAVPAGRYEVSCEYKNLGNGQLTLQVGQGTAAPRHVFVKKATPGKASIVFATQRPRHIFLYNAVFSPEGLSRFRAPGRKMANTTTLKSVKVSARSVAATPPPVLMPKVLTKDDVAAAKSGNHITITDTDVTDYAADAFEGQTGITYVDLSATSITGKKIDRDELKLPAYTTVFLPASNDDNSEKNIVIAGVCNDLQLNDDVDFEIPSDFTAVKASLSRNFTSDLGKNCTVCVPFALDKTQAAELGTFYTLSAHSENTITMESVDATEANKAYMFKPSKETFSAEMVDVKKADPVRTTVSSLSFLGTYQQIPALNSTANFVYYCFMQTGEQAGKFVKITDAVTVNPFRAYMELPASESLARVLDLNFGEGGAAGIGSLTPNPSSIGEGNVGVYDLQGRRVLYPKKGLYILNGKKVIIK